MSFIKQHLILFAVAIAFTAASSANVVRAEDAGGFPVVKGMLDFSIGDDVGESPSADEFFAALDANDGKVIKLDLEIIPNQDGDPGYSLEIDPATPAASPDGPDPSNIVCGDGVYGIVENYRSFYSLGFQHPQHFHAPTAIRLGNRVGYPLHTIICGIEAYTAQSRTSLYISGHFVVTTAAIPTAVTYDLYPYNP